MNTIDIAAKRDYIVNSHERCRKYKVEQDRLYSAKIIEGQELFRRISEKSDLMVTAEHYMKKMYEFVKGTNFFSILTDEEGCILNVIGDEKILAEAFSLKMLPGAYMDERSIGTNAMGTALAEGKPVQISSEEHYIKVYRKWTCSASPIRNAQGRIIGCIDLTGLSENVHPHTLGMVTAASNAIERMLDIKRYNEELTMAKKYTETIIDSISAGILTADLDGTIKTVNQLVADMFGYNPDELKRVKVWNLFEDWEKVKASIINRKNFIDEEVFVKSRKNKLQFSLSIYPFDDNDQNVRDIIFVFKELKKIRKLADKIMGRRAIYTFDKIIGRDENFIKIMEYSKKIADSRSNTLIMGESGTGKELFAQAMHNYSSRRDEPFIALNCGAIPRNLIESELFGYEEGAFTGAKSSGQPGKFEIADGGTIFLDEIGEMPLDMQTRLLRVIEEGTVSRIGSVKETVVDVKVIAATNRDLNEEVKKGNFRNDLYYRLNVLPIRLPPLRERKSDIILLSQFFMERLSKRLNKKAVKIDDKEMKALLEYEWPGNVRELENLIELIVNTEAFPESFGKTDNSAAEKTDTALRKSEGTTVCENSEEDFKLESMEKQHILKVLKTFKGNITLSAKALGIGRNTLYRKMESMGIDCSQTEQCS